MISFLKKVDEEGQEKQSKFMGKGDIIFLLAVGSLVGGFWYFSKSVKEETFVHFQKCDSLFQAKEFPLAEACYEASLDLGYRSDSLDSIGYLRREELDNKRELEKIQFRSLDSLVRVGDSVAAYQVKASMKDIFFLDSTQKVLWESVQPPAPDSTTGESAVP